MKSSIDSNLPLKPPPPYRPPAEPTPAPAWVALIAAWLGLSVLVASIIFVFLPGTTRPRAELEHRTFNLADRFVPIPIYGATVAMFLGIVVLWQMRKLARPLPQGLVMQRVQAWTGIWLGLLAAAIVYINVAIRGPGS